MEGSHSDIWWLGGHYRGVAFIHAGEIVVSAVGTEGTGPIAV